MRPCGTRTRLCQAEALGPGPEARGVLGIRAPPCGAAQPRAGLPLHHASVLRVRPRTHTSADSDPALPGGSWGDSPCDAALAGVATPVTVWSRRCRRDVATNLKSGPQARACTESEFPVVRVGQAAQAPVTAVRPGHRAGLTWAGVRAPLHAPQRPYLDAWVM
jgi:hypothetical protein